MLVDASVTTKLACFFFPDDGLTEKTADGMGQATAALMVRDAVLDPAAFVTVRVTL